MELKKYKPFVKLLFPILKKELSLKEDAIKELFLNSTKELASKKEEIIPILLGERLVLELLEREFLPVELLKEVLREKSVKGLILKGKLNRLIKSLRRRFIFFELGNGFFFVPFLNDAKILIREIFNSREELRGVEVELNLENLKERQDFLALNEVFGFDLLFEKGKREIEKFFGRLDVNKFKEVNQRFLELSGGILIGNLSEKIKGEVLKNFESLETFDFGRGVVLLFNSLSLEGVEKVCEEFRLKAGMLTKGLWQQYGIEEATPILFMLGALEHAIRLRDKHVIVFEGFTYHVLGDLFFEWGDMKKALRYYELGSAYTKQPVELALSRAAICYELGNYAEAESLLKRALCECRGKDPAVYYNLGLLYFKKGLYEAAVEQFYRAHLISPLDVLFREALVSALWKLGRHEEIKELLEDKEDLSFKEMRILGKVYFKEENFHKAYEFLKKGISGEPDVEAMLYLAWIYLYINKESQAGRILLEEARANVSKEEYDRLLKELNIDVK